MSEASLSIPGRWSPRRRIVVRLALVGAVLLIIAIASLVLVQMRFAQPGGPSSGSELFALQIVYVAAPGLLAGGLLCLALAFAAAALPVGFAIPAAGVEESADDDEPDSGSPGVAADVHVPSADADAARTREGGTYDPAAFRRPPPSS